MKEITIEKNFNNKLNCNVFFHLALVPENLPSFDEIRNQEFVIYCKTGEVKPFKASILEIHSTSIWKVPESATMISHEMTDTEFIEHLYKQNTTLREKGDFNIALYVYKKILQ